jgi:hypothetical protein
MVDNDGKQLKSGLQLSMIEDLDNSIFESILPIVSEENSKYPTLLSIVPLFAAGEREKYTTDQHEGLVYPLERGRIRRIGAGLDVYDEDTLIAILQLAAEKKLVGPPEFMPVALPSVKSKNTTVYKGKVSAGSINSFLGRSDGGSDLLRTRESIRRLANQRLWFEGIGAGVGEMEMEGVTDFFKYTGSTDLKGDLIIQISPEMVNLLKSYEVIDMTIRRKLNDIAKAVHRYLLPQVSKFSIKFDDLAEAICYDQGGVLLKRSLIGRKQTPKQKARPNQLDLLVELGFLQEWEITGTGRKKPFVLSIVKSKVSQEFLKVVEAQVLIAE